MFLFQVSTVDVALLKLIGFVVLSLSRSFVIALSRRQFCSVSLLKLLPICRSFVMSFFRYTFFHVRNLGISRGPLKSQAHQGIYILFTTAARNQRGCQ